MLKLNFDYIVQIDKKNVGKNQCRHIKGGMLKLNFDCLVLTDRRMLGQNQCRHSHPRRLYNQNLSPPAPNLPCGAGSKMLMAHPPWCSTAINERKHKFYRLALLFFNRQRQKESTSFITISKEKRKGKRTRKKQNTVLAPHPNRK